MLLKEKGELTWKVTRLLDIWFFEPKDSQVIAKLLLNYKHRLVPIGKNKTASGT